MVTLRWAFLSEEHSAAGAIAPERMGLPFGQRASDSVYRISDYAARCRAIEATETPCVTPGDCPPVRATARYGYVIRSPGSFLVRRQSYSSERRFGTNSASYGVAHIEADPWPRSDSGLVVSWIVGSEYVKIQTGVLVYFPATTWLYQGGIPFGELSSFVATAIEPPGRSLVLIEGEPHGVSELNVVVRLPASGDVLAVQRGAAIAWFFPVMSARASCLISNIDAESPPSPMSPRKP